MKQNLGGEGLKGLPPESNMRRAGSLHGPIARPSPREVPPGLHGCPPSESPASLPGTQAILSRHVEKEASGNHEGLRRGAAGGGPGPREGRCSPELLAGPGSALREPRVPHRRRAPHTARCSSPPSWSDSNCPPRPPPLVLSSLPSPSS